LPGKWWENRSSIFLLEEKQETALIDYSHLLFFLSDKPDLCISFFRPLSGGSINVQLIKDFVMLEQSVSLANSQECSCESIFTSLVEVLKKELIVYQELKEAIISEKKILKKPKLDEINHANAVKENIILKARMLEETRGNILKKISRNLDINVNGIKLMQLAEYAGYEQRKEIEIIRNELILISQEINALNEANKDLLNASMTNIKSSLDFINSIRSSQSVYLECGKMKSVEKNGIYLNKAG